MTQILEDPTSTDLATAQSLASGLFTVSVADGAGSAYPLLPTVNVDGTLSSSTDQDFFSFELRVGDVVTFDVDFTSGLDSEIYLYNPAQTEVAFSTGSFALDVGSSTLVDPFLTYTVTAAGTWYLDLRVQSGSGGSYQLNITIESPGTLLQGTSGFDSLEGWMGADTIRGFSAGGAALDTGNDLLRGLAGNDVIDGGGGADSMLGEDGADTVFGGAGSDTASGGFGDDRLDGGNDNDNLLGRTGADTLLGGAGDDQLVGDAGTDLLQGGTGADSLNGSEDNDTLHGGDGNDWLEGDAGADLLDGGNGADTVFSHIFSVLGTEADTLRGGEGDDSLIGSDGLELLEGGVGNDYVGGGGGNDTLRGEDGDDLLSGSTGDDLLQGGAGNDTVVAGSLGTSTLQGGGGNDSLLSLGGAGQMWGEDGDDTLAGEWRNDTMRGGNGADSLAGGSGSDNLDGGSGNDTLSAGFDTLVDTLIGGTGNDSIPASAGAMLAYGGVGADTIVGGNAQDTLYGGDGNDVIENVVGPTVSGVIDAGAGADTVDARFVDRVTGGGGDDLVRLITPGIIGSGFLHDGGTGTDRLEVIPDVFSLAQHVTRLTQEAGGVTRLEYLELGSLAPSTGFALLNFESFAITGGIGADTLHGGSGADILQAQIGIGDRLFGHDGDDTLVFNGTEGFLDGGAGNDLVSALDGSTGAQVIGGLGDDTVGAVAANALMDGGEGNDSLIGRELQGLFMQGGAGADTLAVDNLSVVSGDLALLSGGEGDDVFSYGNLFSISVPFDLQVDAEGSGTLSFELGTLVGASIVFDGIGRFHVVGGGAADRLNGGGGADTLIGAAGADTMAGGNGDDAYVVDEAGDRVIEGVGGGTDQVDALVTFSLGAQQIENLTLIGIEAINGTGNLLANRLIGNDAANVLNGAAGADTMEGRAGNDTYVVDNAADRVIEAAGGGTDLVFAAVSFSLAGQEIETLTLTGAAAINATGNLLANRLVGNAAANVLNGGAGADTMEGGAGDDTYVVDDVGDRVIEAVAAGTDLVNASVSFSLGAQQVENLTLTGLAAINGTGNALANRLFGNGAANILNGGAGADTLQGGAGNDTYVVDNAGDRVIEAVGGGVDQVNAAVSFSLAGQDIENLTLTGAAAINGTGNALANRIAGNAAANVIDGAAGADTLTGGGGADSFVFSTALGATNIDVVTDYAVADDTILLSAAVFTGLSAGPLAAGAFVIGAAAADASDRIIYNSGTGALLYDADGSGAGAAVRFATLSTGLALTAADFQVI